MPLEPYKGHTEGATSLAVLADGYLVSGSDDNTIMTYGLNLRVLNLPLLD
jgi:hypothetical protein